MASTAPKLQNAAPKRKPKAHILMRERRIESEIIRLGLQPTEIRPFRICCEFLDVFRWGGDLVDLRVVREGR